jgi:hypothetical protein
MAIIGDESARSAPRLLSEERAMQKRRRFKQTEPLADRLEVFPSSCGSGLDLCRMAEKDQTG